MSQRPLIVPPKAGEPIVESFLADLTAVALANSGSGGADCIVSGAGLTLRQQLPGGGFQWHNSDNSSTCPAYGVFRVQGIDTVIGTTGEHFFDGAQSNTYGSQYLHFVNGPRAVEPGKYGRCFADPPRGAFRAAYEAADGTPSFGQLWGPRSGTWKLRYNTGGFLVVGGVDTLSQSMLVVRSPFVRFHGVTDAAIAKDASGTVSILSGVDGGTDTTINMTGVYNSFKSVASGVDVWCDWQGDAAGTSWRLVAAEC